MFCHRGGESLSAAACVKLYDEKSVLRSADGVCVHNQREDSYVPRIKRTEARFLTNWCGDAPLRALQTLKHTETHRPSSHVMLEIGFF